MSNQERYERLSMLEGDQALLRKVEGLDWNSIGREPTVQAELEIKETKGESARSNWPEPLRREALCGLAGDIVSTIEPHSEADPAALLTQFLVGFGSIIGRQPHFLAEADRHPCNLYTVIVGQTSKGRNASLQRGFRWRRKRPAEPDGARCKKTRSWHGHVRQRRYCAAFTRRCVSPYSTAW
jgi:hypothetical protein